MLRLTVRSRSATEIVLQVDGWVAEEDVALLAAEGDRVLAAGQRLVLELGGVMFVDAAGLALLERWGRLRLPGQAGAPWPPRLELRDGSPFIRRLLERHGLHCQEGGQAQQ